MTTEEIIRGSAPDGVRYLTLFLTDYALLFNENNLCATCNNLIASYHIKYKIKVMEKQNDCLYRLQEKYNGIQLEPCSSVFVNNANITNEIGALLLKNKGARIFSKLPQEEEKEEVIEPTQKPQTKKAKRNKKQ